MERANSSRDATRGRLRMVSPPCVYHRRPLFGDAFWATALGVERRLRRHRAERTTNVVFAHVSIPWNTGRRFGHRVKECEPVSSDVSTQTRHSDAHAGRVPIERLSYPSIMYVGEPVHGVPDVTDHDSSTWSTSRPTRARRETRDDESCASLADARPSGASLVARRLVPSSP